MTAFYSEFLYDSYGIVLIISILKSFPRDLAFSTWYIKLTRFVEFMQQGSRALLRRTSRISLLHNH